MIPAITVVCSTYDLWPVVCSTYDRQEGILYLLLEYAEMDLALAIKEQQADLNPLASVRNWWNEMLKIVKVKSIAGTLCSTSCSSKLA